jgi:hypothetical protein
MGKNGSAVMLLGVAVREDNFDLIGDQTRRLSEN